ncbi:hypothetical protein F-S17_0413 [Faustovirus]|nr:hypothetical protein F-LCD7_0416 [Faustovirus]QJX72679.1 hypothetical protein F-S17_0413 [Faustovirus]
MNDDIFPVTPRITDPDLRPRQYSHSAHNDGSLIEFEQQQEQIGSPKPHQIGDKRPQHGGDNDARPSSGFNVLGFNLTYKHIIIIVLVLVALLIVIYLVVNWLRKPGPNEGLVGPNHAPPTQPGVYNGAGNVAPPNGPRGGQQRLPGGPNGARAHPDAGKSASELEALLRQSQNKLNELNAGENKQDADTQAADNATDDNAAAPEVNTQLKTESQLTNADISAANTHMEIPQEQIDNILSTGDDE